MLLPLMLCVLILPVQQNVQGKPGALRQPAGVAHYETQCASCRSQLSCLPFRPLC